MADEEQKVPIIIIKNVKKVYNKHHGGSWKIAYADFVTAMMTFFLLMWLLSLLNKYQLEGISKYFQTPMKELFVKKQTPTASQERIIKHGPSTDINVGSKFNTQNASSKNLGAAAKPIDVNYQDQTYKKPVINTQKELQNLKAELDKKIDENPVLRQFKNQLNFIITADGLKIVIKDLKDKPMFSQGGLDFEKYAANILNWLSMQINGYGNNVMIIGHTDSLPYSSDRYTNWELSADRANATRRILIEYGLDGRKVLRVVGGADTDLMDKENSTSPKNRRIEIIMLTDDAAKRIQNQ